MQLLCTEERHTSGGPGHFLLARSEDALPELIRDYGGRVQLIYLDPPFGTGDVFRIQPSQQYHGGSVPLFHDTLEPEAYLAWMRKILLGCHALLSNSGSLYLHIDYRMSAQLRIMLDEIFGTKNFMNEIVWCYKSGGRSLKHFPRKHDTILFYRKSASVHFNIHAVGSPRGPEKRNHMKRYVDETGRVCFSIRSGGKTYTYYEDSPIYPSDVWNDIEHLQQKDSERTDYATQKPEALLERILLASSRPGDLVMDLFSGSGTTAAVASRLGRSYVVVDASPFALSTLRRRQLAGADHMPLLAQTHEMHLSYPAAQDIAVVDILPAAMERATLRRAYFEPDCPLSYLALGHAENAVFTPTIISLDPKLPLSLNRSSINGNVLHIVDILGRQAFIAL